MIFDPEIKTTAFIAVVFCYKTANLENIGVCGGGVGVSGI